jgi:acid phosphatase family membrane protein YuiD
MCTDRFLNKVNPPSHSCFVMNLASSAAASYRWPSPYFGFQPIFRALLPLIFALDHQPSRFQEYSPAGHLDLDYVELHS